MEQHRERAAPGQRAWVGRLAGELRWAVLLTYLVLLGGTPVGELNGWVQAANAVLAAGLIVLWLRRAPLDADRLDKAVIVALVLFSTSAALSLVPRQSFGAAIQATALAAGFYLARRALLWQARRSVEAVLGWTCLFVVGVTLPAWVATWINWLQAAGWSEVPPLSIWLPPGAFDNRHYIGTLMLLLAPALWSEAFRRRWPFLAVAGTVGAASIVLMDASRTIIGAAVVASVAVAAMHAGSIVARLRGKLGLLVAASAVPLVVGAVAAAPLILERMTNLPKLMARFTFFGNAIDVWLHHPVAGVGPGVYPFSYFLTDYFANTNYAPRHPDNAVAQLIVETGLLGIASATIVLIAIISAARGRWRANPAAVWALTAFLVACVATNPTDFLFLLAPTLIWAAILVPSSQRYSPSPLPPRAEWPLTRRFIPLAAIPVVAAVLLTAAGSVAYQVANDRYRAGDLLGAAHALDAAVGLDPGQALYWRERGSLYLASGNPIGGVSAFRRSLALVPWDPGAMRGLALADLASGDPTAGLADALAASRFQPHSAASAIVVAVTSLEHGDPGTSASTLSTALLEAPYLGFLNWSGTVLSRFDVGSALTTAAQTASGHRAGETGLNAVLLVLMGEAGDAHAAAASGSTISGRALAAVAACDEAAADREIRLARPAEREYAYFWIASALVAQVFSGIGAAGPELAAPYVGLPVSPGPLTTSLTADGGDDVLRYRRTSLDVRTPTTAMPNVSRGLWLLISDPTKAMSSVTTWPPSCQSAVTP